MAGTLTGGQRARDANRASYGDDYYQRIGSLGGSAPKTRPSGFRANRKLASIAGRLGGSISRRASSKTGLKRSLSLSEQQRHRKRFERNYAKLKAVHKKSNG